MPQSNRDGKSSEAHRESLITALDSISPRRRAKRRNPAQWVWLLVPVAALWLNWTHLAAYFGRVPTSPALPVLAVRPSEQPTQPSQLRAQPASVTSVPSVAPQIHSPPQALSDCLSGGTAIDEQVLRCRFGDAPRQRPQREPSHGMVSAAYLAQYETQKGTRAVSGAGRRQIASESHWISGWDGNGQYLATWQIVDNDIDASSVCMNYRRGSIEFRECRKGAKQWFKTQCRGANAEDARRRYCSAASSFSPMG